MSAAESQAAPRVDVMKGRLADFNLEQVLQVVSIGRQLIGIDVDRPDGPSARILTKSGQVLAANAAERQGRAAFRDLFQGSYDTFRVYRVDATRPLPKPLGSVRDLLADAKRHPRAEPARKPDEAPATPEEVAKQPAPAAAPAPAPRSPEPDDSSQVRERRPSGTLVPAVEGEREGPSLVVAVASPKGGVGKTTIALHLAVSLASRGHRTVLVDADVNGDVMSMIDGRERPMHGAYDAILDSADPRSLLLETALPELRILPACGAEVPHPERLGHDLSVHWRDLFAVLDADIVVVDTPAGTFGPTWSVLQAASHVLGVLQAETVARRSFERFGAALESLPETERPAVLGVVFNMLQMRLEASMDVFAAACAGLPAGWLFDVSIPRNPWFLRASHEGVPLGFVDPDNPPAIAWLFDNLAAEVAERLLLTQPKAKKRLLL